MRISKVQIAVVSVPFTVEERWAWGRRRGLTNVILQLHTDEGLVGLGEAVGAPSGKLVAHTVEGFAPMVVGENPFEIERITRKLSHLSGLEHTRLASPAICGIEMALWDIVGKACGQPLVNLFGGRVRDQIPFMFFLQRKPLDELAADAVAAVKRGFRTLYLKVGMDPRGDVEAVEAVRAAVGREPKIRLDANEAWSPGTALRMIQELSRFDLELMEQPVSGRNLEEMAYVRSRSPVPILSNEAAWNRFDVLTLIQRRAADVISLECQMDNGLFNMKRTAGICETAGLPVLKHTFGELGVSTAASLHVMASTVNFLYANQSYVSCVVDDVIRGGPLPLEGECLTVPEAPGIGVDLDEDRLKEGEERYRREGDFTLTDPEAARSMTPSVPRF